MTKTTKILSAASAAALLGISSVALAQSPGGPASTAPQKQEAPAAGTMGKDSMSKDGLKSNQAQQGKEMDKDAPQKSQAQSPAPDGKSRVQAPADSKSQVQAPADSKSQMSQDKDAKSGTTVGAAGAGAVNLTTEQRTTIRQTVLTSNAPRATNINFTVNVGTAVPSSVRIVEVPDVIIRIHPQWKGYRYFVYNDDIIIVEPRTLKIVAVLNV
jgi:pentapeptide MXKDX repeat protein